jgi:hypothetical protein
MTIQNNEIKYQYLAGYYIDTALRFNKEAAGLNLNWVNVCHH